LQILPGFEDYFNLSLPLQSLNVAIVSLGSVFAAPFGAYVPDKYGRKWGMAATAIVSLTGAIIQSAAQNSAMFFIERFLVGVSVTLSCIVSPE
jgi:MFS family permease